MDNIISLNEVRKNKTGDQPNPPIEIVTQRTQEEIEVCPKWRMEEAERLAKMYYPQFFEKKYMDMNLLKGM